MRKIRLRFLIAFIISPQENDYREPKFGDYLQVYRP